jgi:ComF family protein
MLTFSKVLNAALPQTCVLCEDRKAKSHVQGMCSPCLAQLPWRSSACCPQCGIGNNAAICGQCLSNSPFYDTTTALFAYFYPIDAIVHAYKYQKGLYLSRLLGELMAMHSTNLHPVSIPIDGIVAMPMHPERLRERGFNQSHEIAKIVSRALKIPLYSDACQRIINTPPQATLALKERAKNIKGAFDCANEIAGLRIAVIDDVMTSGASLNELAKTLKKSGAKSVHNWVIARTL